MTQFTLLVGGERYSGWKSIRVTRGLERATSDFELAVSERWAAEDQAWQIFPGSACEIYVDDELLLTGWVDAYRPGYGATSHEIAVSGRSRTCDFVDASVTQKDGQFKGLTPAQLARLLAEPFELEVIAEFEGTPIPDVQLQQGETCFALVERMARLQELLITDDADGRLVLTRAGLGQCSSQLVHGRNILTASADHDDSERFSDYIVLGQRAGVDRAYDDYGETGDEDPDPPFAGRYLTPGARYAAQRAAVGKRATKPKAMTQVIASTKDEGVTRYRPKVIVADAQVDGAEAAKRADWEMRRRLARAKSANITVAGWRQRDGRLWQTNENVYVFSPWLGLAEPLLIGEVEYGYGPDGEIAGLHLVLPDVFLPERHRKTKTGKAGGGGTGGKGDGGNMWSGRVIKGSGGPE